jgi:hypothetical protein
MGDEVRLTICPGSNEIADTRKATKSLWQVIVRPRTSSLYTYVRLNRQAIAVYFARLVPARTSEVIESGNYNPSNLDLALVDCGSAGKSPDQGKFRDWDLSDTHSQLAALYAFLQLLLIS